MSSIHLIGINYKSAPVEVREKFALNDFTSIETWLTQDISEICESFILSTCNRVEILFCTNNADAPNKVIAKWAEAKNQSTQDLQAYTYHYKDFEAVKHLFEVAASLDSLVLGEPQILGQIKDSYRDASKAKQTKSILNSLMHKAFFAAKRVRSETQVASNAVSISYAAVELTKRIFDEMQDTVAMLIGAGEMAKLAAMHLIHAGVPKIYIANRTKERADLFVQEISPEKCQAIDFAKLVEALEHTDIIISQTGASELILNANDIKNVVKKRKNKAMFFIDIAVPRDIDPDVNNLDNVYLYDIDDLKEVVEENLANRRGEAEKAKLIIEAECHKFLAWLNEESLKPAIMSIIHNTDSIIQSEYKKTLKKLPDLTEDNQKALNIMLKAISKKVNHNAIEYLKKNVHNKDLAIKHLQDILKLE